jgi:DNA primase
MSRGLSKEQVEDLLDYIDVDKVQVWKGDKIQFCCPIHGEGHPSCGINVDWVPPGSSGHYQVFHCFSCGKRGTLPMFLYLSLPDKFKTVQEAEQFLVNRYNVEFSFNFDVGEIDLSRYDDRFTKHVKKNKRFELAKSKLAPFMSGKETYQYYFDRGFTVEDMQYFMIGRDLENETVTIPAFWQDGKLAGIIGRYVDPRRPKNMRFKVYEFPKGSIIYPLDKLQVIDDTIIGVESMLDAQHMHKWNYRNTVAMMGDGMSDQQADMIASRCNKFVDLFDNDEWGLVARERAQKALKGRVMYLTCDYPDWGKDPSDWGEEVTNEILATAHFINKSLPRL